MNSIRDEDLSDIWNRVEGGLEKLRGKTMFLTGSTGPFGIWILSFLHFMRSRGIKLGDIYVLSRDPMSFVRNYPQIANGLKLNWIKGDIRNFEYPKGRIDLCIHGATTSAKETFLGTPNLDKFLTVALGTQRILDFVTHSEIGSFLYLSSGAVFGGDLEPSGLNLDELYVPRVDHLNQNHTLGHAKRSAETLCLLARENNPGRAMNIARLFTFVGPYIPLDVHYAVGNFLGSAKTKSPIKIRSDGSAIRSFMYMSDAITWILKSLIINTNSDFPLHIGSEKGISIKELAKLIDSLTGCGIEYEIESKTSISPAPSLYVPSTVKTRSLLGVDEWTNLSTSVKRTLNWVSSK